MKRLLTVCPMPSDATSFYRGVGPLSSLQNKGLVDLVYHDKPDWTILKHVDAVFMQRPHLPEFLPTIDLAKKFKKPIWMDFDDLLTDIPDCSPARYNYWRQEVQDSVRTALKAADIITVSTKEIAEAWTPLTKAKFVVIPNAWDDELFPKVDRLPDPEKPNLLWRGSAGHDEDLWSITPALEKLAKESDYNWYFIGQPFWHTVRRVNLHAQPKIAIWHDLPDYFKLIRSLNPAVMMVPITDTPFNRCKSNIAWIEGTWAGAATVAPDWGVWNQPGIIKYTEDKPFDVCVKEAVDFHKSKSAESWAYIESELRLSKVNELRETVLREIGLLPSVIKHFQ